MLPVTLPPMLVAVPLASGSVLAGLGRWLPRRAVDLTAIGTALASVAMSGWLFALTGRVAAVTWVGGWIPRHGRSVGIVLVVDRLGAGLAGLVAVLVTAALVYSWHYFDDVEAMFQALVLFFLAGLTGFAITGDLFDMFVFFELMGAVAYALTGYKVEEPQSLQGALNFGVINSLGAYCSLTGITLLYARTGQLGLAQLGRELAGHPADPLVVAAFVLVCTGFLVKAAMVPFHFWLADAHAVAPTPVCVLFSGVMVELGVYAVARVYWVVFSATLPAGAFRRAFLVLGSLTALAGAVMCLVQHHIKRLLAYSTISHVGVFLLGLAVLDPDGLAGTATYVAGHAGVKGALFLGTGILLNRYETVDEAELHGVGWRRHPALAVMWTAGGLALAGLPPFGTFAGKSLIEHALNGERFGWGVAVCVLASALTGGAVLRVGLRVFWGVGRPASADAELVAAREEPETTGRLLGTPVTMLAPMLALLVGALLVGALGPVHQALTAAAGQFVDRVFYLRAALGGAGAAHPHRVPVVGWTGEGLAAAAVSVGLAALVALAAVAVDRVPRPVATAARRLHPPMLALRRLHSGHVGDYVAWLATGVALLAGLTGL
ncbi:MAG TPA: complex I subunit 5 family protein [Mycobacteriales bacterium]|nr:complex I subunit 5 family protein [Mycobacteriales bacterium]